MKKNLTEIVFILDRSGSMSGLEADTIGGFNSMIAKQKKQDGEALVSTVLFDNVSEVIHDRVNIRDIQPMTERDYTVRGCTALLDAIGGAIHHIGNIHKYARPEGCPGAYAVYHHNRRDGECESVLQQRPGEADDRAAESKVWLGVPVPRRKH